MKTFLNRVQCCFLLMPFLALSHAMADDELIYESLSNVKIGLVFYSPAERDRLDRRRRPRSKTIADGAAKTRGEQRTDRSAGYIMRSDGVMRVYEKGEFVKSSTIATIRFPGEIHIEVSSTPAATNDDQLIAKPSGDAADDEQ